MQPNSPVRARTSSPTPSPRAPSRVAPSALDHAVARHHRRHDDDDDATTTSSTTTTSTTSPSSATRRTFVARDDALCVECEWRSAWVLAHADVRCRVAWGECSDIRRLSPMFGHSASQSIDARRTTHERTTTTTTRVGPARECDIVDDTHTTGVLVSPPPPPPSLRVWTHTSAWTVRARAKARVGRLKRTHDHATGDVDDGRG